MKFSSVLNLESSPASSPQPSSIRHANPPKSSSSSSTVLSSSLSKPIPFNATKKPSVSSSLENVSPHDDIEQERKSFKLALQKHRSEIVALSKDFQKAFEHVVKTKDSAISTLTTSLANAQDRIPASAASSSSARETELRAELDKAMEELARVKKAPSASKALEELQFECKQLKIELQTEREDHAQTKVELRAEIERANSLQDKLRNASGQNAPAAQPTVMQAGDEKDTETILFYEELTNMAVNNVSVLRDLKAKTKQSVFDTFLTLENRTIHCKFTFNWKWKDTQLPSKRLNLERVDFVITDLTDQEADRELAAKLKSFADPNGIEFEGGNMSGFLIELSKRVVDGADSDDDE